MTEFKKFQQNIHDLWVSAISLRLTPHTHDCMREYFAQHDALKSMNE